MTPVPSWSQALRTGLLRTALLALPLLMVLGYAVTQGSSASRLATVALINVIIVVGIQTFTGNTGIVSFGHIGFVALGAYVTALLTADPGAKAIRVPDAPFGLAEVQLNPFVGMAVAVLVALAVAAFLGTAVARMGGISATMITLGLLIIVYNILTDWVQFSGGAEGFFGVPVVASVGVVLVLALLAVAVASVYRESPAGLRAQAVREDELAARATGVDPARAKFTAWLLSAGVCAAGGALLALFLGAITPRDFYLNLTFTTLAMLFVGGVRTVSGAVVGVLVITVGNELFRWLGDGVTLGGLELPQLPGLTDIFLGLVIAGTMLWRTQGLMADTEVDDLLRRRRPATVQISEPQPAGAPATPRTLEARALERTFGGLRAVAGVDLTVRSGEVVGLIGPNGSGKSTLLNMLSGVIEPTGGQVLLDGRPAPAGSHRVAAAGIGRTFQNIRLFPTLTAGQNIAVGAISVGRHRDGGTADPARLDEVVRRLDLTDVLDRQAGTLPYGVQRRLEIARALSLVPDFVLLDEPVAGMNEVESTEIADVVRLLAGELGCGVLVVDHDLPFILGLCERIHVMDSGRCIATGTPAEVRANAEVVTAYLGVS